ncbi:MAG TPA: CbtA family protein [Pseudonocardiaceae bacterium]
MGLILPKCESFGDQGAPPAKPPSVGNLDTIGQRTALYCGKIGVTVLLALAATVLGRTLAPRWGNWNAAVAAVASFLTIFALKLVPIDEIGAGV